MKNTLILVIFLLFSTGVFGDDVRVYVMEGDSVTLHTNITIQKGTIDWWFGEVGFASVDIGSTKNPEWVDRNVTFGDRLQLNKESGDLKITNIKFTDSGTFKLKIKKSLTTFIVSVVTVNQMPSVLVGEFVTLSTGVTDTTTYDVIRWRFGDQSSPIAEVNRMNNKITLYDDVPDGRFKDRLQLDYWTGSLTITNTRTEHTGFYEVDLISSNRFTVHKLFTVTVSGKIKPLTVKEGDSVNLKTDAVLQTHDFALWMFGDTFIVSILNNKNDVLDERFRDRLKLDHQTGSLTIMNTRNTDTGLYEVIISRSKHSIHKKYNVMVTDSRLSAGAVTGIALAVGLASGLAVFLIYYGRQRTSFKKTLKNTSLSVMEGENITLQTGVKVGRLDMILWMFKDQQVPLAQKSGFSKKSFIYGVLDERFKDRLKLDDQTGSLIITDTTTEHTGEYQLQMMIGSHSSVVLFTVIVFANSGNESDETNKLLVC